MPTPPPNHPSAVDAFAHTIASVAGQIVQSIPKQSRVRDLAAMEKCRRKGKCENPSRKLKSSARWNPIDPHHGRTRGSGGGDTEANLMNLCRTCHDLIHKSPEFKDAMAAVVARRMS